jgi:LPXTG-site transpeptidase (sortase) family protein
MKVNRPLKLAITIIFLFGVAGAGAYLFLSQYQVGINEQNLADNTLGWKFPTVKLPSTGSVQIAVSSINNTSNAPKGLPVRLKIPTIGVDSAIEDAFITPDGRMDVPAGSVNVAWFALGPHPGQVGSAVIGGHYGIKNNVPFVFYKLNELKVGDKVYVVDDKGNNLAFVVRLIKSFDRNADATTVFTSQDGLAHLNLVTCEGIWNRVNNNYPQRLVVFTDAVPLQ